MFKSSFFSTSSGLISIFKQVFRWGSVQQASVLLLLLSWNAIRLSEQNDPSRKQGYNRIDLSKLLPKSRRKKTSVAHIA